jgi:tetrahydromethanopterin S-methyltransferase subunit F
VNRRHCPNASSSRALPATFTEEIMGFVIGILVAVILVIVILELI